NFYDIAGTCCFQMKNAFLMIVDYRHSITSCLFFIYYANIPSIDNVQHASRRLFCHFSLLSSLPCVKAKMQRKALCLASGFNAAAGQIRHSKTYCTLLIEGTGNFIKFQSVGFPSIFYYLKLQSKWKYTIKTWYNARYLN
ncbi:MAG: hypothetical protein K0R50_4459, partial [Eubacterium sp.]|nr:hypothetical protein [Eubacterium sp.]